MCNVLQRFCQLRAFSLGVPFSIFRFSVYAIKDQVAL